MTTPRPPAPGVCFAVPEIETERLRLRAPEIDDLAHEIAFYDSPRAAGVGGPEPRHEVFHHLAGWIGHWVLRGFGLWAVEAKATGRYLGRVGLWFPDPWPEPEIAWTLMDGAEGHGFAHEAALAARAHAYGTLGWATAISLIAADNLRSIRLAERLGARPDGAFQHPDNGALPIWRHPGPAEVAA